MPSVRPKFEFVAERSSVTLDTSSDVALTAACRDEAVTVALGAARMNESERRHLMNRKLSRLSRFVLSAVAVAGLAGVGIAGATPALADTNGSLVVPDATVAPGGTFTATLTPNLYTSADLGGYYYFCYNYYSGDASTPADPGHSVVLLLQSDSSPMPYIAPAGLSFADFDGIYVQFDAPGLGSITPSATVTTPTLLSFTLPSDIPEGTYTTFGGCVSPSPELWSVGTASSSFTREFGTITVTASGPTPPSPSSLPDTGMKAHEAITWSAVSGAALIAGIGLVLMSRRVRR